MFDFTDFEEWLFYQAYKDQYEIEQEHLRHIVYMEDNEN